MADVFAYLEGFGVSGGEGGTLKVNAPPLVAVTITNKAGKTKTKTANADGMAIFKGLASGKWNVTIVNSDGKPTTITADVQTEYTVTIAFFSATINITYPAGSTCTCTDGTTTLTAPDTSGTWACIVPNAGTWTATSTSGTETDSKAIAITTDGQNTSVELSYATYLYNLGDACDALTGGWQAIGKYNAPIDNGGYKGSPSVVNGTASLDISLEGSCGLVVTKNKIDLTGYQTLTFRGDVTTLGECSLAIWSSTTGDYMPSSVASAAISTTGVSVECSLDLSAITGSYYIGLALKNTNAIAMKQLYLED